MNFSAIIKDEIISKPEKKQNAKMAFLTGVLRGSGKLFEKDGEIGLDFFVPDEKSAMLIIDYISALFGYEIREVETVKDRFKLTVYGSDAERILTELKILISDGDTFTVNFAFYDNLTENDNCLQAFIKGLFVSSGTCTIPSNDKKVNTGYHLEIPFAHVQTATQTQDKLLKKGVKTKVMRRKNSFVLYIKSVEEIKNFIAFLPAPLSVLKLTDLTIERELTNNSNRQKNCDMANLTKQVDAGIKYAEVIDFIDKKIGLSTLKKDLFETAKARKEFQEDTLLELAERLGVSKSCLNHRLRKLVSIANELKGEQNG